MMLHRHFEGESQTAKEKVAAKEGRQDAAEQTKENDEEPAKRGRKRKPEE